MGNATSVKRHVIPAIVLSIVCSAIFFNTLGNEFVWDDISLITKNPYIRDYKNIPLFFTPHYWNELNPFQNLYRPIRTFSFAVDYYFWELNPTGYHLTNILLHTINVVLVFYLATIVMAKAADRRQKDETVGHPVFMGVPFLTALFFATHPIHTESIALIKNRSELLAFLLFLISFLLFIKHLDVTSRIARRLLVAGAWLSFTPAVMSKEMALTLPGVLALYIICFSDGSKRRKALIRIVPYGIIIIIYFWFMSWFIRTVEVLPAGVPQPQNIIQHLLTTIKTIGCYIWMMVVPFPLNIEHNFSIPASVLTPSVLFSLILIILLCIGSIKSYQRSRIVSFAILWVLLTLMPATNFIYLVSRPVAEQRLYFPSFGYCLLLGYGINRLSHIRTKMLNPGHVFIAGCGLTIAIVGLYAGMTVHRNFDWHDSITLFSRTLVDNPDSATMHSNLAYSLMEEDQYEEALSHLQTALRLDPNHLDTHLNLGIFYNITRQHEKSVSHYQAAIRLKPDFLDVYHWLGILFNDMGRFEDAVNLYKTVLIMKPGHINVHFDLGLTYYNAGQFEKAINHYQIFLRLKPNHVDALNNIGTAYVDIGQFKKAADFFKAALNVAPDNAYAGINMGIVLVKMGHFEKAVRLLQGFIPGHPDWIKTHFQPGVAHITTGRFEEAIRHYATAIRLQPSYIEALNSLCLALAKTGHAAEATGYYQEALKIMPDSADIYYNLGVALSICGKYQDALTAFSRSLKIDPDYIKARIAYRACLTSLEETAAAP